MNLNEHEIELLYKNPDTLLVNYQSVIRIIVSKFIQRGFVNMSEKDDFIQIVNEKLLIKIPKIQDQYDGSTLLRTYLSVIIRNICLEEIRKQQSNNQTSEIDDYKDRIVADERSDYQLIISQELIRLNTILRLFYDKRWKFEFCLKVIYRISIVLDDFLKYCKICNSDKLKALIIKINPPKVIPEKDLYIEIKPFINKCDNKNNSSDAIRKWLKLQIDNVIDLMNGKTKRSNYNRESIQILFEKYFENKA